jgi:hypothetical protein
MSKRTLHLWGFLRTIILLFSFLPVLAQVSQSTNPSGGTNAAAFGQRTAAASPLQQAPGVPARPRLHIVPLRDPNGPNAAVGLAAPAGAQLSYFGGPVISNIHVVQVLYGSGSYNTQVAGTTSPTMGNFYSDLTGTNSGYTNLLAQYNTTIPEGTNQTIGYGTFDGLFQIVPSDGNNGSTITDDQIQSELLAQITAGHLPAPLLDAAGNVNTLYMIFFPPGKTITQGGESSCQPGGFCAYHGTTSNTFNSNNLLYGVHPDMQSGLCSTGGCGSAGVFGNYTSVTSHELTEAITDPDVGIAFDFAPPLAWYDMVNGEIGDICNGQQGTYVANGTSYTIQLEFSNAANDCVLPPPPPSTPDFFITGSPTSQTITAGGVASYTATVTAIAGFSDVVAFSASGLPSGASATFNPTSVTGSGSSTMSVTTNTSTPTGAYPLTITGTTGALAHSTTVNLLVNRDFTISVSPASNTVLRGSFATYTVIINPVNGFTGTVNLSVSGLDSRETATFNPAAVTGSGFSSLRVTTTKQAAKGTRTFTITGVSGSLSHSTIASLTIQ